MKSDNHERFGIQSGECWTVNKDGDIVRLGLIPEDVKKLLIDMNKEQGLPAPDFDEVPEEIKKSLAGEVARRKAALALDAKPTLRDRFRNITGW